MGHIYRSDDKRSGILFRERLHGLLLHGAAEVRMGALLFIGLNIQRAEILRMDTRFSWRGANQATTLPTRPEMRTRGRLEPAED